MRIEMSIMENDVSEENGLKKMDFIDPLGANDPLGCSVDDENDGVEFDVSRFVQDGLQRDNNCTSN